MDEPPGPGRDRLIGRRGLIRAAGLAGAAGVGLVALSPEDAESARLTPVKAVSVKDHGAAGDGAADDRPAIQAALDAAGQEGGTVFFPPGDYLVGGPLAPSSQTLMFGSHTPRWEGGMNPPSPCKIRMAARFSGGEGLIEAGGDTWGVTLRNLALVGDDAGSDLHGLRFPDAEDFTANESWALDAVTISGFSGSGIYGCAQTTTITNSMIEDNRGWGIDVSAGNRWNDCHLSNCFLFYNRRGNVRFAGAQTSGFVEFVNCRFERAGTNPDDVFEPRNPSAPGVLLANARYMHFVNCTTDANCGNGFEIVPDPEAPDFLPALIGLVNCHLSRDGTGDNRDQGEYAGLKVLGAEGGPERRPVEVKCVNCFVTYGKADDAGKGSVFGPRYGVWHERTRSFGWIGGHVSVLPAGNEYRSPEGSSEAATLFDPERGLLTLPLKPPEAGTGSPDGSLYLDPGEDRLFVRSRGRWKSIRLS